MRPHLRCLTSLLLLPLACAAATAHAACDESLIETLRDRLHSGRTLDPALAACKPWGAFPGRQIVVLPLVHTSSDVGRTLDLEVLVVQQPEGASGPTVLAHLFQQEALEEDAVRIKGIAIDTARYQLAPGALAFGVRVQYSADSRANPYSYEGLRLYLPDAGTLREVLSELEIDSDSGEWDTVCDGRFEKKRGVVSIRPTSSAGLADLVLVQKVSPSLARKQKDGGCKERPQPPSQKTIVLKYDGQQYRGPKS